MNRSKSTTNSRLRLVLLLCAGPLLPLACGPTDLDYSRCCACLESAQCIDESSDIEVCAETYDVKVADGCDHGCDLECQGIELN